ncbi:MULTISPECIES: RHS repeat-associated core domain-containing protein [Marinobacter]|uniref:RHS repeat-associated core domain-containing protein n=1 Tax=Marinobacter TaxID=2742 RepID=UPI001B806C83|nr:MULTISPECIES: RHS repeat-associated core domain-containing protein [Marinobacter]
MLLNSSGDTENAYRYTGEQLDPSLDQYYLRARYYDQSSGRFTQIDTWMGHNSNPITLHKYLYGNADPVTYTDPTGKFSLGSISVAQSINAVLTTASVVGTGFELYGYASGNKEVSAENVGWTAIILLSGPAVGKVLKGAAAIRAGKALEAAAKSGNLGKLILTSGRTSEVVLRRFIPGGSKNSFKPSANIASGYKYQFKIGETTVEFKWHAPDLAAAKKFPDSNSGSIWTAQIKIGRKLLGADGKLYSRPSNETHIPIDIF